MGFDISPLHLHNGKQPFQGKRLLWTSAAATAAGDNDDANDNGGGRSASAGRKAGKLQTGHQNTPVSPAMCFNPDHFPQLPAHLATYLWRRSFRG